MADVDRWRSETPGCRERLHLNNAGASLMPESVLSAMKNHLERESEIGGYEAADERREQIAGFYAAIGALIGSKAGNIAFAGSATTAYARALSSIPFERGDLLVTTRDDYISNQIAFLSLSRRFGIEILRAPNLPEGGADAGAIRRLLRERSPRLVAVTHVPTNSGLVQPIAEIGEACREAEVPYLVDACQSAGQLPLDVETIGCDFLSATGRKFLRGPRGTGFLFVSDRALRAGYEPLFLDMRGADWTSPDNYEPSATASRFEEWEFPYAALLGCAEASRYASAVGLERISRAALGLASRLREGLAKIPGVRILDRGRELCSIVTAAIGGWTADSFKGELDRRRVNSSISYWNYAVLDFREKNVEWALRLSPHYFNTEEEVSTAIEAVREIVAAGRAS